MSDRLRSWGFGHDCGAAADMPPSATAAQRVHRRPVDSGRKPYLEPPRDSRAHGDGAVTGLDETRVVWLLSDELVMRQ